MRDTAVTTRTSLPGLEHSSNESPPAEVLALFRHRVDGPGADAQGHSRHSARHGTAAGVADSALRDGPDASDRWRFAAGFVIGLLIAGGIWLLGIAVTGRITLLP